MSPRPTPDPSSLVLDAASQGAIFRSARTPKAFLSDPVTEEQLVTIHDLVKWGPTMTNSQPLRVVLARTPDARSRVVEQLLSYNQDRVANAPVLAVFCADLAFNRLGDSIFPNPGMGALYDDDSFRERVADSQAWMQAGFWITGIRAAGLDVLPMMGFDTAGLDAVLASRPSSSLPGAVLRSLMVAAIGRADPASYPPQPARLDIDDVVVDL